MSDGETAGGHWVAEVVVLPKPGVNDPPGESIRGGLHSLGYTTVASVRAGRFIRLQVTAESEAAALADVTSMCNRLLANPVIETFAVSVHPAEQGSERT